MKIDMFTHSNWFGNDIYVSPNENIYCLYPFDGGLKTLIIDEDIKLSQFKKFIEGTEEPTDISEVLVYWMYVDCSCEEEIHKTIREIVAEYEENPKEFFKKYNTKGRN